MKAIDSPESRGTLFRTKAADTLALDVAENMLLMDELRDLISEPAMLLTQKDLNYPHDRIGEPVVREHIAALLSKSWGLQGEHELAADHVLCTPGASAALHLHAQARLSPGDTVMLPAPYWQMFDRIYQLA